MTPPAKNPRRHAIAIVGGGIQGASLAFHLARSGAPPVVLYRPGGESATGRSSGMVRMHYDLPENAALAWRSLATFVAWNEVVGGSCGFVRTGFLQLVPPDLSARLRANVALQRSLGIATEVIGADEVRALAPDLDVADIEVAAYEPGSGYADPAAAAAAFLAGARACGASLLAAEATSLVARGDRITGVATTAGLVEADTVVLAAGAWSRELAATIGLELPIRAWVHDTAILVRPPRMAPFPAFIDFGGAMYVRPEGDRLVLIGLEDGNPIADRPGDVRRGAPDFTDRVVDRVAGRLPRMADAGLHSTTFGIDGITPDQQPIIGPAAPSGPEGLWLDTGFSGTGFKTAPAVGESLAAAILRGWDAAPEIAIFGLDRFSGTRRIEAPHPYPPVWH